MKRILLLWVSCALLFGSHAFAQNVFNPNDTMVEYDPLHPPATPPANTLAKWIRSKKMDWNTDKFKSYYYNGMSFRLRYPNGYNPANTTKKYPLILFLHGGGEIGPITDNENQLLITASLFQDMIDQGKYDAFLLYPQVSEQDIWEDYHFSKINNFLDSLQKYCNLDQDRVLTQGLSMGAYGAIRYSAWYPQRSSLATGASPALIQTLPDNDKNKLLHIPLWLANGGLDNNPDPASMQAFADYINANGGNLTRNYYPEIGHPTWPPMYTAPLVLPFWLSSHKANPAVFFKKNQYDLNLPISTKLGLTAGFYAYEWQRDSVTIATATNGVNTIVNPLAVISYTGNEITVNSYGSYRARFKRTSTSDWSEWSQNPAQIYKGLKFNYYEGPWTSLPDFNAITPIASASGTSPNVDIDSRPPDTYDHFAMKWEGSIYIPTPGNYTFETYSDDGSKLYFNTPTYSASATALVDNDGSHGAISKTGTVNVPTAGWYPIIVTYLENAADQVLQLYWSGPNFSRQLIPNSAFTRPSVQSDVTAPTVPTNLKSDYTGRTFVDLSWTASTDNVGVARYDVYVNGTFKLSTTNSKVTVDALTTGTAYNFTVKAIDQANNASAFSNTLSATAVASGLRYKYYEGNWSVLPDFSTLPVLKTGTSTNFDLTPKINSDHFGFVWEGYIHITTPGVYTFETQSDDGSKMYFNTFYSPTATALVNNDGQHGPISATGTTGSLAAGWYPITVTFFDATLDESIKVFWTGPGIARQQVPDAAFVESTGADVTPPTAPTLLKSDYTGRTFADLSWTPSTDNVGVVRYDVYVNGVYNQSLYNPSATSPKATVSNLTAGSNYTFNVYALDAANNPSGPSNTLSATAAANGLRYKYYEGSWSVLPNFSTLPVLKTGTSANFDLSTRNINDNFGFVWEGYLHITTPGTYTFETQSDDGSKFYFNTFYSFTATATVDNDGQHGAIVKTGTVNIPAAGWYPITATFFDATLDESIKVFWTGPGITRQLIPDAAFVETTGADVTPPSVPSALKSDYTGRTFVDLSWTPSIDDIGVTRYDVYVNSAFSVSTTTPKVTIGNLTAGTNYTFSVKAFDQANNASAFSNTLTVIPAASGLRYKYYEGSWSVLPNFSTLPVLKTGTSTNVDLTPKINSDYFGFVWEGYIHITTPGTYTFETQSDDGSKLYFNTFYSPTATALVDNDGQHGAIVKTGTINVATAGYYPITITFFDANLAESIKVFWTGPGIARQQIPDAAFVEAASDAIAPTAPSLLKSDFTTRTFADLSWTASTDNVGVVKYDVYVNDTYNQSTTTATKVTISNLTPGASYVVTVKAIDAANNVSASSNSLTVIPASNGLRYKYYEGAWSVLPNFSTLPVLKTGTSTNVDLTPKINSDYFGFVWEGYIHITTPGTYTFETQSDDGSKLYFNTFYSPTATALVDNDGQHGAIVKTGTINVATAGYYPITITFFDANLAESIQVYWTGPGFARQLIPNSAFTESVGVNPDQTFKSGLIELSASDKDQIQRITAYPNPFNKDLEIGFYNSASDNNISVDIYDLSGRMLYNKDFGRLSAGINTLHLNLSSQSLFDVGTYIARLRVNGLPVKTWKLVKVKK